MASVAGECRLFERPQYQLKGKTAYDQRAVDSYTERGVGGCGWARPARRPESWDAKPKPQPSVVNSDVGGAKPKPKRRWWQKWKPQA